jgi:hypothetical protein
LVARGNAEEENTPVVLLKSCRRGQAVVLLIHRQITSPHAFTDICFYTVTYRLSLPVDSLTGKRLTSRQVNPH